jgi:ABC-2 type transport system permease protein
MTAAWAIFRKELRVYLVSPLATVFLAAFLFLSGLFFYLGVSMNGEASLRVMMGNLSIALMFLLPMLTMRHFAEEQRAGTLELLMTAPIPLWALLVGKWAATVALCMLLLVGTLLFPGLLEYYGDPDWGVIGTSYLGLALCCVAFVAAGMFASSLTEEPVTAGILGVLVLLPFWLAGTAAEMVDTDWLRRALREISLTGHVDGFSRGIIDSADVLWFVLFTFSFLFLTWRSVESRRWR